MTEDLNIVEKCVSCLDVEESYDLARRMEQEKTNPVLGYRTAGSLAERKTGDMLCEEMKKAGLYPGGKRPHHSRCLGIP